MENTPKLHPRAKSFFEDFCVNANKRTSNPFDDIRFNAFITACHIGRSPLTEWHVEQMLIAEGFDAEYARALAIQYAEGRELLKPKYRRAVHSWKNPEYRAMILFRPEG